MALEQKTAEIISYQHIINWSVGLLIVLALFFLCIWLSKKTGLLTLNSPQKLRVVSALSLGVREKIIVVQVGDKQLVLGVTPSRIEKLLLLEDEACLQEKISVTEAENSFAIKLKQAMTGSSDE